MPCLMASTYNMKADILRQVTNDPSADPVDESGEWVMQQDPDSGEIIRVWKPGTVVVDDPDTPEIETSFHSFDCIARGLTTGGIKGLANTELFTELYESSEYVLIKFGPNESISKRDRITNIRDIKGNVVWKEEEHPDEPPTVFSVMGVTPIVGPFGEVIEKTAMLERSEIQ